MAPVPLKDALRRSVLAARAAVTRQAWAAEDEARTQQLLEMLGPAQPGVVALYASRPGEPGTTGVIDALAERGWTVLLPVLRRQPDWAEFRGWRHMTPGWNEIPEPTTGRLGAGALRRAQVIIVSALAVGRDGTRLGTGGGWYDRALAHRDPSARVIALSRDAEIVDAVPTEPHDVPVDGYATESVSAVFSH